MLPTASLSCASFSVITHPGISNYLRRCVPRPRLSHVLARWELSSFRILQTFNLTFHVPYQDTTKTPLAPDPIRPRRDSASFKLDVEFSIFCDTSMVWSYGRPFLLGAAARSCSAPQKFCSCIHIVQLIFMQASECQTHSAKNFLANCQLNLQTLAVDPAF